MPVLWFEVTADLSPKLLKAIKFTLNGPIIGSICFFIAFAGCMTAVAASAVIYAKKKDKERLEEEIAERSFIDGYSTMPRITLPKDSTQK